MGGWVDEQNKAARAAVPVITQNFISQTTHDVDLISVAEESKYFTHKWSLCAADSCTGQFWR